MTKNPGEETGDLDSWMNPFWSSLSSRAFKTLNCSSDISYKLLVQNFSPSFRRISASTPGRSLGRVEAATSEKTVSANRRYLRGIELIHPSSFPVNPRTDCVSLLYTSCSFTFSSSISAARARRLTERLPWLQRSKVWHAASQGGIRAMG